MRARRFSDRASPSLSSASAISRFPWLTPDDFDQKTVLAVIARCSTIGPSASAGKKVRPPIIRITPTTKPTNRPPVVGSVPAEGGIDFLAASEPAIAIAGAIMKKRPTNIAGAPGGVEKGMLPGGPAA